MRSRDVVRSVVLHFQAFGWCARLAKTREGIKDVSRPPAEHIITLFDQTGIVIQSVLALKYLEIRDEGICGMESDW